MRRILAERARKRDRVRHGGGLEKVDWDFVTIATEDCDDTVLAIHEALEKLARQSPQKAEIVKLRYFTGLEQEEIAQVLGISESTVRRHWAYLCPFAVERKVSRLIVLSPKQRIELESLHDRAH